jgi:polysaccharide export outer membrane protein
MRITFFVVPLLAIASIGSMNRACASLQEAQAAAVSAEPQATVSSAASQNYVIGPGDILQISVWQEPQFDEKVEVRPDGKISLPLVSDVHVAGMTPPSAQAKIADVLQTFVKHPRVSVIVTEVHSRMVYVIGEVQHPGPYPMVGPINVGQLIASAGGTTKNAHKKQVYVLRQGSHTKIHVNYQNILDGKRKGLEQNVQLNSGDTVVVP